MKLDNVVNPIINNPQQDGAPKIAKLVYKWLNNCSYWGL